MDGISVPEDDTTTQWCTPCGHEDPSHQEPLRPIGRSETLVAGDVSGASSEGSPWAGFRRSQGSCERTLHFSVCSLESTEPFSMYEDVAESYE